MQIFLPFNDFRDTATILDNKRLWKQILEANQLMHLIIYKDLKNNYRNHPIYKMWENYLPVLSFYRDILLNEWLNRRLINPPRFKLKYPSIELPKFLGNKEFHLSHASNLLRKNFEHYYLPFKKYYGFDIPVDLPYVWPV